MLRVGRFRAREEEGFTLPELLIVVVLMGLLVGSLSMALVQSLTLLPEASGRSQAAVDRRFAIDALSDDVANATSVTNLPITFGVSFCAATGSATVVQTSWTDGAERRARWTLTYASAANNRSTMTLERTHEQNSGSGWDTVDTEEWNVGYCSYAPASNIALRLEYRTAQTANGGFCPAADHPRLCVALDAGDSDHDTIRTYRFTGAVRTLDPE